SESAPLVYHERLIAWALDETLVVCQRVGERAVALARRVARGPQHEEAIASAERGIAPALVRAPPAAKVVAIAQSRIQLDRRIDGDGGRGGADHAGRGLGRWRRGRGVGVRHGEGGARGDENAEGE